MATLSDVARRAGVSKATASRALNRPDLVAPHTSEKVRLAAADLQFTPNRTARHLALGRTGVIAMLIPTMENTFFTPIIGGAQDQAREMGLYLTVATQPLAVRSELLHLRELAQQVDGFLIVAPRGEDNLIREAMTMRPSVLVDREMAGTASVIADTASAFSSLFTQLADKGHRRIAFASGPAHSWQMRQREAAVAEASARLEVEAVMFGPSEPTFEAGQLLAPDIQEAQVSAVLPYAKDLGLGLLFELVRSGFTDLDPHPQTPVPGRIEVIGVPGSHSVAVDGEELGRTAFVELSRQLQDARPTRHQLHVPIQ